MRLSKISSRGIILISVSRQGKLAAVLLVSALPMGSAWADQNLVMNGKVVSTSVRTVGGSPYVKLSDVARALSMAVIKQPGGYEIARPGGANQVQGLQGKIGDLLFDGRWRFQVLSVSQPDAYTMKTPENEPSSYPADTLNFDRKSQMVRPKPGYKLVVIQCRISNGQKSKQTFWLAAKDGNNALADLQGESYAPVGYDLEGAPIQSKPLLPGAKTQFPILFCVPQNVEPKDLVFTLRNNDFTQKGNDVRVSLTPALP